MSQRTPEQDFANEFDLDLYRLILRAENRKGRWPLIAQQLRDIRPDVRRMMHEIDRGQTI